MRPPCQVCRDTGAAMKIDNTSQNVNPSSKYFRPRCAKCGMRFESRDLCQAHEQSCKPDTPSPRGTVRIRRRGSR